MARCLVAARYSWPTVSIAIISITMADRTMEGPTTAALTAPEGERQALKPVLRNRLAPVFYFFAARHLLSFEPAPGVTSGGRVRLRREETPRTIRSVSHSITSSARARTRGGNSRPGAAAARRPRSGWLALPRSLSDRASGLEIDRRFPAPFRLKFIADLLAFIEAMQTRTLNRADVDENVLAAAIGLNEAKSLRGIEPLHRS